MNCPNCGAHVPTQRRLYSAKPATFASRTYKRVWMRAKRSGMTFPAYVRAHLALYRADRVHDADVLELPLPESAT